MDDMTPEQKERFEHELVTATLELAIYGSTVQDINILMDSLGHAFDAYIIPAMEMGVKVLLHGYTEGEENLEEPNAYIEGWEFEGGTLATAIGFVEFYLVTKKEAESMLEQFHNATLETIHPKDCHMGMLYSYARLGEKRNFRRYHIAEREHASFAKAMTLSEFLRELIEDVTEDED
jgi:hypothetical protein